MNLVRKITATVLIITLMLSVLCAYGVENKKSWPSIEEVQRDIKSKFGVNIILDGVDSSTENVLQCIAAVENNLERFPDGIFAEISSYFAEKGIQSNIVICKNNVEGETSARASFTMTGNEARIEIDVVPSGVYSFSESIPADGVMHELGHYICEYIKSVYGYDKLKSQLDNLNGSCQYKTVWQEGYETVFIRQNSVLEADEDIADLIWYVESKPEYLREIGKGKETAIHGKIRLLEEVFGQIFESVDEPGSLWPEALPDDTDAAFERVIEKMKSEGLLPDTFEGKCKSDITRNDFTTLSLILIRKSVGDEEFYAYFNIKKPETFIAIDPVSGNVEIDDAASETFYDVSMYENKKDIYTAYKLGLLYGEGGKFNPESSMTKAEAARVAAMTAKLLGADISAYGDVMLRDTIDNEYKPYVYYAVSNGIIAAEGGYFRPDDNCTYREAYMIMNKIYDMTQ